MSSDRHFREAAELLDLTSEYRGGSLTPEDRERIYNLATALGDEVRISQTMMPGIPLQDRRYLAKSGDYP